MFDKVFISYAREDESFAIKLFHYIKKIGYSPWIDKENIDAGKDWMFEIEKALSEANFIILLLSNVSVSKRGIVQREFKLAVEYCKNYLASDTFILPIKTDDCEIPFELSKKHCIDVFSESDFMLVKKALDKQRDLYLAENGVLKPKIIIERKDKYLHPTFKVDYYISNHEYFCSAENRIELTLEPGHIEFQCAINLWEGAFGSRYKGYLWLGRSEKLNIKASPGSIHLISINEIKPYKSLRGGINGIFRVARRLLGDHIPDSHDRDTYPLNIRASISFDT